MVLKRFTKTDIPSILKADHVGESVVGLPAVFLTPNRLERDQFGGEVGVFGSHNLYVRK